MRCVRCVRAYSEGVSKDRLCSRASSQCCRCRQEWKSRSVSLSLYRLSEAKSEVSIALHLVYTALHCVQLSRKTQTHYTSPYIIDYRISFCFFSSFNSSSFCFNCSLKEEFITDFPSELNNRSLSVQVCTIHITHTPSHITNHTNAHTQTHRGLGYVLCTALATTHKVISCLQFSSSLMM